MVKYFTADYILPVSTPPLKKGVVAVHESGEIIAIYPHDHREIRNIEAVELEGIIVPGFVNAHCHLELSHLKGKLPRHQGLISFISSIIQERKQDVEHEIKEAILSADKKMFENGIVAVGDISNTIITREAKISSQIYYHTFLELLCFQPDEAKATFRNGINLKEEFQPLKTSIVPHAPYSVCKDLFRFISKFCGESGELMTIHNQESEEENKLYRYKTGAFLDFYKKIGRNIDFFKAQARNSLQSYLPHIAESQKVMLVHNIYTSLKDIYFVRRSGKEITWCFCPNANLYIENNLPKIEMFDFKDFNITIGTDSLASNDHLCILSELKTLHKHFSSLSLIETIKWATLNGAKFLGIDEQFGSIERGKKPGLNLVSNVEGLQLTPESFVKKLI